ncbi:MAG: tRNA lysidine(34) synthetase TilS [Pseudomonadota bacterium]
MPTAASFAGARPPFGPATHLIREFKGALPTGDAPFLLAVSGGSDSLALMHLCFHHAGARRVAGVATVDHQLRAEARAEAQWVAEESARLGYPHTILPWDRPSAQKDVSQALAREARFGLLAERARSMGVRTVLLGHTLDDQLETLRMRLQRLDWVDYASLGLSGIAPVTLLEDVAFHRPLLGVRRDELRQWLSHHGADRWIEDPSNDSRHYERVRVRQTRHSAGAADLMRFQSLASRWRSLIERDALALAQSALHVGDRHVSLRRSDLVGYPSPVVTYLLGCVIAQIGDSLRRVDGAIFRSNVDALIQTRRGFAMAGAVVDHRRSREIIIYREVRDADFSVSDPLLAQLKSLYPDLPRDALRSQAFHRQSPAKSPLNWQSPSERQLFDTLERAAGRSR